MHFTFPAYHHPDFTQSIFVQAPQARLIPAPKDGVVPDGYHATTIYPEYYHIDGHWLLAKESRMDCVAVYEAGEIKVCEMRRVKAGDLVVMGRSERCEEGIYVHYDGFVQPEDGHDLFAFRQGRSRETAYSMDYDSLYELLRHEKEHGFVTWVLGPACAFDADSRDAFGKLVSGDYVHALLAGNALATHDLEAAYLNTALGQNVYTQRSVPLGHYNHIDTINKVRQYGSIPAFIQNEKLSGGIICNCVAKKVPFVLAGSIRDDGPLPEVYGNVYEAQDAMRSYVRRSTTVICLATVLHSVVTGNMTPSYRVLEDGTVRPVYFYSVDISEFAVNKLRDRGSLAVKTIVTNVQDFVVNVSKGLGL